MQEREETFARERSALEARAAKFGLELAVNPYGEDLQTPTCARREIPTVEELAEMKTVAAAEEAVEPDVEVMIDTLHVFGVDRLRCAAVAKEQLKNSHVILKRDRDRERVCVCVFCVCVSCMFWC